MRHRAPLATYPDPTRAAPKDPYLVLLQVGFTLPFTLPHNAVRSYRTFSPLPAKGPKASPQAVCFLWHFPSAHAAQMLSGTLPCGARTFLRPVPPAAPKGLAADTGTAVVRPTPGRNLIAVCG